MFLNKSLKRKLLRVYSDNGFEIFEYSPSFLHLFLYSFEPLTFQRRVRFLLELLKGYKVYYLVHSDEIVAYCVISRGGGRYNFAGKNDIVVGPYFVIEEHRGKHYSEQLVSFLLNYPKITYRYAYDWIRYDNIPSIRCAEKVGFYKVDSMDMVGPFRILRICHDHVGDYWLFKFNNIKNENSNN